MPITSSAKKALRAGDHKRVFNLRRKNALDKDLKAFRKAVTAKNATEAGKLLPALYQSFDKAAKTGYLKPNAAARGKSRAMAALKKLG